ncbi:hypothetical protein E1301_Tti020714 [Triplophysa tibetana]|uniref:Uncharacterized protein n=1 Tax=Triplophysa tibetana TaxID=1572043 RepID=A0A5A9PHN2_9TELE|nr:hypothetical protein E1301_Tti020714 [Triplophysa tibetana]
MTRHVLPGHGVWVRIQSQDVDSEEEGTEVKKKKIAQAPRIVMTVQGLSDVGVQCGPLHSDIKDALSLETDAHHHEPSLHQLLPAADEQVDYRPFNEMHPIGRNDIAYSKLTETLAELVSEVKELRLEVQGFMRRQLPITPALPLSLPLKSMTEFEEAERILQSEDARRVMDPSARRTRDSVHQSGHRYSLDHRGFIVSDGARDCALPSLRLTGDGHLIDGHARGQCPVQI